MLFLNNYVKFLKISSLLDVREAIHIGEVEHQCNCRIREGSILSDLCCAFFDIYTFVTREVDYPEYAYMYKTDITSADCFDVQSNGVQIHSKHFSSMLSISSNAAHITNFAILEKMTLKTSLGLFSLFEK